MPPNLKLLSPTKLNLFLRVLHRRDDGYHELQSLFQVLAWGDHIELSLRSDGQIEVVGMEQIPSDSNLAYRAAKLMQLRHPRELGVDIRITKRVPLGSGLGGGSANAATVLKGLNWLLGLNLGVSELQSLAAALGADVPLFVTARNAYAGGRGDLLTPVSLPRLYYLLALPPLQLSTAEIFEELALTTKGAKKRIAPLPAGSKLKPDFKAWSNDLEALVIERFPLVAECRTLLNRVAVDSLGPARLSGSGAALFLAFDRLPSAHKASRLCSQGLERLGCKTLVAAGI